jgi:general stress protein 26
VDDHPRAPFDPGDLNMTRAEVFDLIGRHRLAVVASVSDEGAPQAAVIGITLTARGEIVFDTLRSSRKYRNITGDHRVSLVVGWDQEITVQIEGEAREPSPAELDAYQDVYFAAFPDGRARASLPDIVYLVVRSRWVRYSDFRSDPPVIMEFEGEGHRA